MLKPLQILLITSAIITTSISASDILASVNGKNITKQDAQIFITASVPNVNFKQLSNSEKRLVTEKLIEKQLFAELAEKEGLDNSSEFKKNMQKIKEELLINMWMKAQIDNIVISDSEAKKFYINNKQRFMDKESAHARHILVKTKREAKNIIKILKSVKSSSLKRNFIMLAKSKSTGPSSSKGGDLGTFNRGQMVPAFSNAVWRLNNGEITTTPVRTQFGYHIIYLEKKSIATVIKYQDVKNKIIDSLKQQQFNSKILGIAKELKKRAKIVHFLNNRTRR